ncbi:hypothetical protein FEM48_Zijuj02G0085200 [Ziziphus jujuba var. spinosa]|uniref:CCT domain-containing protein n=1 Tax=Ziziphus jujuba var. spinosa TaxID=714518 RepID=A0A978VUP7_ZIZJJ|nr:hypothetical protein FEM48_Zijuj02G0085200 [Ziziphus jujuba var. spinosa]
MSHPFPDVLFSLLLCLSTPGPFHTALPSFPSPYPFPPPPRAMYGYHSSPFPRASDSLADSPFPPPPPPPPSSHPPFLPDHFSGTDFDSLHETLRLLGSEVSNSCSSGCSSYGSPCSLGAHKPTLIQRSVSSHSLQKNGTHRVLSSVAELLESSETGPVRRVYSTGDLQGNNMVQHSYRSESPLSNESSMIIEGMTKACRYSPEEKKERIERKTLADSRPRIRGRFARNDEIEKNSQVQWSHMGGEEDEEDEDNWINILDALSSNLIP